MNTEIRAFIAIELPLEVKTFLTEVSSYLKRHGSDVKWVKPEGIHLTLKFLGNIHIELVEKIEHAAKPVFSEQSLIDLGIEGLGAFPTLKRPRVIWAGCLDSKGRLPPLVAQLENALENLGLAKEKREFNPHLTLGRVRSNAGIIDLAPAIRQKQDVMGPAFAADHAVLFQSVLSPAGAQYTELRRFDFSATHSPDLVS
jgi:RNA 2',3'-cyclic 3'-phosphodiesterase